MKRPLITAGLICLLMVCFLLTILISQPQHTPHRLIQDMEKHTASSHPHAKPPAGVVPFNTPPSIQRPDHIFTNNCAACHGATGRGNSYTAAHADMPQVGDLTTSDKNETELTQSVLNGRGAMPSFRNRLPETAVSPLIQYIIQQFQQQ